MLLRITRILVCISQFLNVLLGGRPNEMLSAKLHRLRLPYQGTPAWKRNSSCVFCSLLNFMFWEQDHCREAYRAHARRLRETLKEDEAFSNRYLKLTQQNALEPATRE